MASDFLPWAPHNQGLFYGGRRNKLIIARGGHGCHFAAVRYTRGGRIDGTWHYDMLISWHRNAEFAAAAIKDGEPHKEVQPGIKRYYLYLVRHAPFPLQLDLHEIPWREYNV